MPVDAAIGVIPGASAQPSAHNLRLSAFTAESCAAGGAACMKSSPDRPSELDLVSQGQGRVGHRQPASLTPPGLEAQASERVPGATPQFDSGIFSGVPMLNNNYMYKRFRQII